MSINLGNIKAFLTRSFEIIQLAHPQGAVNIINEIKIFNKIYLILGKK